MHLKRSLWRLADRLILHSQSWLWSMAFLVGAPKWNSQICYSNLTKNRSLAKKEGRMPDSPEQSRSKVLSNNEILEEWKEIQAAQKDPKAFSPLYSRYFSNIFKFIYRRTDNEQLTGDLTAQVFLKALQKIHSYTYKGVPFSAWLYRIASNEVVQHYRNQGKNRVVSMEEYQLKELISDDNKESKEQELSTMINLLDELKEEDIRLIELRFFEQRPFKEIAEILDITENNTKVKTYRILERLRKKLIKQLDQHK